MPKPEVKIRPYRPEDYETVRAIFDQGMKENFIPALIRNWNWDRPKTTLFHLTFIVCFFLVALVWSKFIGFTMTVGYLAANVLYIKRFYYSFAK